MLQVYSIYDNKVDTFNKPIYINNYIELVEMIQEMFKDENIKEEVEPKDYDIYQLGEFDTNSGKHESFDAPKHMIGVQQVVKKKEAA